MGDIIVIGAGPAGMMAAIAAADNGGNVLILEKNKQPCRKLRLTGKGRCNLTNDTDLGGLLAKTNANPRFLYSAFNALTSADLTRFFEDNGVPLKTERGKRVFPKSGRAEDIVNALEKYIHKKGARIKKNETVCAVEAEAGQTRGVRTETGFIPASAVIVATGGLSYPATGSTGDGFRFARALGHSVTPLYPSLVPLITAEPWVPALAGLSLKNVCCTVIVKGVKKPLFSEIGELLFTHNGISGPLVLSASRFITDKLPQKRVQVQIDLKPGLNAGQLDERVRRDFEENNNKYFLNALDGLLPRRLIKTIVTLSGIPPERRVNAIQREERLKLGALLKCLTVTPVAAAGYAEAVITMGGVDVREVDPSSMMSKKVKGLYFAGEVLDVDAMTGGFNLQIAFSTGYLAGLSAGKGVGG